MKSPGNSDDNISYSSASSLDIPDELVQLLTEFNRAANSPNRSIEMPRDEETPRWTIFQNKMEHLQKNALAKINKFKSDIAVEITA